MTWNLGGMKVDHLPDILATLSALELVHAEPGIPGPWAHTKQEVEWRGELQQYGVN